MTPNTPDREESERIKRYDFAPDKSSAKCSCCMTLGSRYLDTSDLDSRALEAAILVMKNCASNKKKGGMIRNELERHITHLTELLRIARE